MLECSEKPCKQPKKPVDIMIARHAKFKCFNYLTVSEELVEPAMFTFLV